MVLVVATGVERGTRPAQARDLTHSGGREPHKGKAAQLLARDEVPIGRRTAEPDRHIMPKAPSSSASNTSPMRRTPQTLDSLRNELSDVTNQLRNAQLELNRWKAMHADAETPTFLRCPISLQRMHSPVVVAEGHTFERRMIETWFRHHDTNPLTGATLPSKVLVRSLALYI